MKKKLSKIAIFLIIVLLFACSNKPESPDSPDSPDLFTLTIEKEGEGYVVADPESETYEKGTEVTITATSDEDWVFLEWKDDLFGDTNPAKITMDGNKSIKAVFHKKQKYTLTVTTSEGGSVSLSPATNSDDTYYEGTEVILTPISEDGYMFDKWEGDLSGNTKPGKITMDSDKNVKALFKEVTGDWLFMMYMGGDCNLEYPMWRDVNEMEYGLHLLDSSIRQRIKVVVLWDGHPSSSSIGGYTSLAPTETKLYELGPDPDSAPYNASMSGNTLDHTSTDKWWDGDEVNMGDGVTLTRFLDWAKNKYEGYNHHTLIMSDHGGGPGTRNGSRIRAAVWDESNDNDYLETKEIANALAGAGYEGNNKLSILCFDACLMASVEEAYEHSRVADYYVASLETEQGDGWEYDHWIPQITAEMSPVEIGTILVQSYKDSFQGDDFKDQTLSCIDLSKMGNLKTAIDNLGQAIINTNSVDTYKDKFESSQRFNAGSPTNPYYLHEVGDFISKLSSTDVATQSNAVAEAMKESIVYSWAASASGDYYGEGQDTGKGLHLVGSQNLFSYDSNVLSFADGAWADLYNTWY